MYKENAQLLKAFEKSNEKRFAGLENGLNSKMLKDMDSTNSEKSNHSKPTSEDDNQSTSNEDSHFVKFSEALPKASKTQNLPPLSLPLFKSIERKIWLAQTKNILKANKYFKILFRPDILKLSMKSANEKKEVDVALQKAIDPGVFQVLVNLNPEDMSGVKLLLAIEEQSKVEETASELDSIYRDYLSIKRDEAESIV